MAQIVAPVRRTKSPAFSIKQDANGLLRLSIASAAHKAIDRGLKDQTYFPGEEPVAIAMTRVGDVISDVSVETLIRTASLEVGEGVVVIDGLPYEAIESAPYPGMSARSAKDTCLSELLLLGFGGFMGAPYGVASEGDRLVVELIPLKADIETFNDNGSRKNLGLHRENAAPKHLLPRLDFSPKALMLTGVNEQTYGGPITPAAIAARAVTLLDAADQAVLREPCAHLQVPKRWRTDEAVMMVGPVPVILGFAGREQLVGAFYDGLTRAADAAAAPARARLEWALELVSIPLGVSPCRLVYLANGNVLHGRSDFEPEFSTDGRASRWLQRIFLAGRIEDFRTGAAPHWRVFDLAATAQSLARPRWI